jgi:F420-dependent methylenetetrahydromethanopterin dehydrogenase
MALTMALQKCQNMEPKSKAKKRYLGFGHLHLAMTKFAIAAEGVGFWSFASALAHLDVLGCIAGKSVRRLFVSACACAHFMFAAQAGTGETKRKGHLAMVYDEVARKDWAEKAARGDIGFCVREACRQLDPDLLSRAKRIYDTNEAAAQDGKRNNSNSSGQHKAGNQQSDKRHGGKRDWNEYKAGGSWSDYKSGGGSNWKKSKGGY